MDLQLGLAVSCVVDKGFDLNSSETEIKGDFEATPVGNRKFKKRNFHEGFGQEKVDVPPTLPLLVWDSQTKSNNNQLGPGDDLDDEADSISVMNNKRSADERNDDHCVVGWPPVNSWRKKICQQQNRQLDCVAVNNGAAGGCRRKSMYVKVKMEGVGIARKVDMSLHHSHHTLLQTLLGMFGKSQESVEFYQLKYQDEEGDWQLVEDANWGNFKRSVKRLELVRKE